MNEVMDIDYLIEENDKRIEIERQQITTRNEVVELYKAYRKQIGLTQTELGKRAGVSQPNITRFESGNYNPTLEFMVKMAAAMGKKVKVSFED